MVRVWLSVFVGTCAWACKSPTLNGESSNLPGPSTDSAVSARYEGAQGSLTPRPFASSDWRRAVSEQRWRDAASLFDTIEQRPTEPPLRYVRARIAAELGDNERVIDLLNGLDDFMPAFATEIGRMRADAALVVGPYRLAAEYFEGQPGTSAWVKAARAWLLAGEPKRAKAAIDQAWKSVSKDSPSAQAPVRSVKASVLSALRRPRNASAEHLWLVLEAPTSKEAKLALRSLQSQQPPVIPTKQQRYRRAEAFAGAGDLDAVLTEIEALDEAPGARPSQVAINRTLAWAYYNSRRDYSKAAELFEQCARQQAAHRAQDHFYSARALSRAHQDELAIARYEALIRAFPSSRFSTQARQLIGRLWYALGQWRKAVTAHEAFIRRYQRSAQQRGALKSARYERAVALLAMKDERAVGAFNELVGQSASERERALLRHLLGVAQLDSGNKLSAVQEFQAVISSRPLSFAALASAARLRDIGEPVPTQLPPAEPSVTVVEKPLDLVFPDKVSTLVSLGLDIDAESELHSQGAAFFRSFAPRSSEAACLAYGRLSTARQRYRLGVKAIRERAVQRAISPNTHWMWDCMYPQPYSLFVEESEERHGVPAEMIYAVMRQESAFHPTVRSPANAYGLMQLIEPTARRVALDMGRDYSKDELTTPAYNIELGAHYLSGLLRRYDGQLAVAAAGYNAGPGAATRWLKTVGDLPLDVFVARILYSETRSYVQRVVGNWARYLYLRNGEAAIPELNLKLPTAKALAADDY